FGPDQDHFALGVDRQGRVLAVAAAARRTLQLADRERGGGDRGPVKLSLCLPGREYHVASLRQRPPTPRAIAHLPPPGQRSLKTLALVVGGEQVHVPVDLRSGRAVEQVHRPLAVRKRFQATAAARTGRFTVGRDFRGEGLALVGGAGHPHFAARFA